MGEDNLELDRLGRDERLPDDRDLPDTEGHRRDADPELLRLDEAGKRAKELDTEGHGRDADLEGLRLDSDDGNRR